MCGGLLAGASLAHLSATVRFPNNEGPEEYTVVAPLLLTLLLEESVNA